MSRFRVFWAQAKAWEKAAFENGGGGQNPDTAEDTSWPKQYTPGSDRFQVTLYSLDEHGSKWGGESSTWTEKPGAFEGYPMYPLLWGPAQAFCIWDGGYLPTEAQWTYAFVGGAEHREYPWGSAEPDSSLAIYDYESPDVPYVSTLPVGSKPKGAARWGHVDMAGNAEEWMFDYISNVPKFPATCDHCVGATPEDSGTSSLAKGGNYNFLWFGLHHFTRGTSDTSGGAGFRCARPPSAAP